MPDLRVAIVGCGAVTERSHLPAAVTCAGLRVTLLVDQERSRAETLARRFDIPLVQTEWTKVAAHADAAIVALPHALHAAASVDLLSRGVHVLVEKPMALSPAECDTMIAAAASGGRVLAVGHVRRFMPGLRRTRDAIAGGALGSVESLDIRDGFIFGWPAASDSFFDRRAAGGGVLLNVGVHDLDLLLWWLGDLDVVDYADDARGGLEADAELCFSARGGAQGRLELSVTRNLRNTALISGSRGRMEVGLHEDRGDPFREQLLDWCGAIERGRPPAVDGAEGRRSVAVVRACYARRRPLELPWLQPVPLP